jgi:hypothetical protein
MSNYEEYLKESLSISDMSLNIYLDIWNRLESILNTWNNKTIEIKNETITLTSNNISINSILNITIRKYKENICNMMVNNRNPNEPIINIDIYIEELNKDFKLYIKSVCLHESVHIMQLFNQKTKQRSASWSIGAVLSQVRPHIKSEYNKNIIELVYRTLDHEIAAYLHQYFIYKHVNDHFVKIENLLKELQFFNIKELSKQENDELNIIKKYFLNSIKYNKTNRNYLKDTDNSIWNEQDNTIFLQRLKLLFVEKINYIKRKIGKINAKLLIREEIDYTTMSLPSEFMHPNYDEFTRYNPEFMIELLKTH